MITLLICTCQRCGEKFSYDACRVARGRGKFCSKRCAALHGQKIRWATQKVSLADRYWRMVEKRGEDECWGWNGFKHRGYGRLRRPDGVIGAHRVSYEIHFGPIPEGMTVCHRCDNPECSNPLHLFLGTNADNNRDRDAKGRAARGERAGRAKLTTMAVRDIRRRYANKEANYAELAREHGVGFSTVRAAVSGQSWRHVL